MRIQKKFRNTKLKAIELFAGIGGFRLACDQRGIDTIWANDICPNACKVYESNFGNRELRMGDIRELQSEIPSHDLLTAGFPCQPFSSAGKKNGISDPRGTLFEVIVETLRTHQPKYFILENVKRLLTMDKGFHFATILSALAELDYFIEWRLLNTSYFGLPQNRERIVITGTRKNEIQIPNDINLGTPLDLSNISPIRFANLLNYKDWTPIEQHKFKFPNWGIAFKGKFFGTDLNTFNSKSEKILLQNVLQKNTSPEFDLTQETLLRLKSNAPINKFIGGVEILSNQRGGARMGYTIFGTKGLAPTLTSSTSRHYERYKIGNQYRRLTNVEYARIQGFPDNHCSSVPLRYQYVLYGNAVASPLVGWVLDRLLNNNDVNNNFTPLTNNLQFQLTT